MMTVLTIWTTLDNVKHSIFNEHMEGIMHVSIAIAAIMAGFTILKNYNGFVKGDGLDAMLLLKPIMMLFLIGNFHTTFALGYFSGESKRQKGHRVNYM